MEATQPPARLVIRQGEHSRTISVDTFPFTIGREPDSNLVLPNTQVSRQHAVLLRDHDGYVLQALGSRHGTLINGVRHETVRLQSGDRIQLGLSNITLLFLSTHDPRRSTTRTLLTLLSNESSSSELEKLTLFLQAAQSFNNTRVLEDVITTMLEYTLRLTKAERGFVFLGDAFPNLTLETGLNSEGQPLADDSRISRSILRDSIESGREFLIGDVSGEGQPVGRESIIAHFSYQDSEQRILNERLARRFDLGMALNEAANRAIYQCAPYKLPATRYNDWKEINPLRFDPREMMGK